MINQEKNEIENKLYNRNNSLSLLRYRLEDYQPFFSTENLELSSISGVNEMAKQLKTNGGFSQHNRMIKDKKRSLDRALLYSYQAACVKKLGQDIKVRALINPNKLKQDYDDKIISIGFEHNFQPGDIFEWVGTNSYWLIYLQNLTELAYFRGDIRKCSYQITWYDGEEKKSTYAAVRGPVETKIDYIQKHGVSVDTPNYSLSILLPRNEDTLKQFKRYSKFYLQGVQGEDEKICWRVEATDSISTPGILEITAVEYYANEAEDDIDNGIVGGKIEPIENPNNSIIEELIQGETFIKPKKTYIYKFSGDKVAKWDVDKKLPLKIKEIDDATIELKWVSTFSGQFDLSYGETTKTIVVESLF